MEYLSEDYLRQRDHDEEEEYRSKRMPVNGNSINPRSFFVWYSPEDRVDHDIYTLDRQTQGLTILDKIVQESKPWDVVPKLLEHSDTMSKIHMANTSYKDFPDRFKITLSLPITHELEKKKKDKIIINYTSETHKYTIAYRTRTAFYGKHRYSKDFCYQMSGNRLKIYKNKTTYAKLPDNIVRVFDCKASSNFFRFGSGSIVKMPLKNAFHSKDEKLFTLINQGSVDQLRKTISSKVYVEVRFPTIIPVTHIGTFGSNHKFDVWCSKHQQFEGKPMVCFSSEYLYIQNQKEKLCMMTKFKISYHTGKKWVFLPTTFSGNTDARVETFNELPTGLKTKAIRVYPIGYSGNTLEFALSFFTSKSDINEMFNEDVADKITGDKTLNSKEYQIVLPTKRTYCLKGKSIKYDLINYRVSRQQNRYDSRTVSKAWNDNRENDYLFD